MRIVLIRSNPVAPYPRLEKTANSLIKQGHKILVLAWDRSKTYRHENSKLNLPNGSANITRFGIPSQFGGGLKKNLIPLMKFQLRILSWLIRNRKSYDVIHAYDFDTGAISLICAKLLRKKLIYDIPDYYVDSHNLRGSNIGKIVQRAENTVINKADAVIICTEKRKQQISGTKPKKLIIVHNSPNDAICNGEVKTIDFKGNPEKLKIVYVGILDEGRFIKEIAETVSKRSDCEFHVGGFGNFEEYLIKAANTYDNIFFYGKIPYNQTLELERYCDVITAIYDPSVPNHFYAAPNKFYESLMLGKPDRKSVV